MLVMYLNLYIIKKEKTMILIVENVKYKSLDKFFY